MKRSAAAFVLGLVMTLMTSASAVTGTWNWDLSPSIRVDTVMNGAIASVTSHVHAMQGVWNAVPAQYLSIVNGGDFNIPGYYDIGETPDGNIYVSDANLSLGVNGITQWRTVGGNTKATFVAFNYDAADLTWYVGTGTPAAGQMDFRAVALHELGHSISINHIGSSTCGTSSQVVMSPFTISGPNGSQCRDLTTSDTSVMQGLYG